MPLGTLDRTPPPFFKQGPSALTRLVFFSALALFLMVADTRFALTHALRAAAATVLHPLQRTLLVPVQAWSEIDDYFAGLTRARQGEAHAREELARQAVRSLRVEQLELENERLRKLLELRARLTVQSQAAEVLYEAADPYTRKVFIDRGGVQGVALGAPVIDDAGVVGQVTRVYPLSSEVTLINDKDAAIPVLNTRTQQRGAAYGHPSDGGLELRFMAGNADVQVGDVMHTSGVDGVYPGGLPVGKVLRVDRRADSAFAKIVLAPLARPDSARHVMVLEPVGLQTPLRTDASVSPAAAASAASAAHGGKPARARAGAASGSQR